MAFLVGTVEKDHMPIVSHVVSLPTVRMSSFIATCTRKDNMEKLSRLGIREWLSSWISSRVSLFQIEMGCKQDDACHNEFQQNDKFFGVANMPQIAGFNYFGSWSGSDTGNTNLYKQCLPGDATVDTSICRQCCKSDDCSLAWRDTPLTTAEQWNDTTDHDFDHVGSWAQG